MKQDVVQRILESAATHVSVDADRSDADWGTFQVCLKGSHGSLWEFRVEWDTSDSHSFISGFREALDELSGEELRLWLEVVRCRTCLDRCASALEATLAPSVAGKSQKLLQTALVREMRRQSAAVGRDVDEDIDEFAGTVRKLRKTLAEAGVEAV